MNKRDLCHKCGCFLVNGEEMMCIPCLDDLCGEQPTEEEWKKYYNITREYPETDTIREELQRFLDTEKEEI